MTEPKRMTAEDLAALQPGDIVAPLHGNGQSYIVTANHGNRVTAVRTADITNPIEWLVVRKATAVVELEP